MNSIMFLLFVIGIWSSVHELSIVKTSLANFLKKLYFQIT